MKLYLARDFPAELSRPCDYLLLAKAVTENRHIAHVANLANDRLRLTGRSRLDMFDEEKLRQSNVYTYRCSHYGAAHYCGTEDVTYSFHINRRQLSNPYEPVDALHRRFTIKVADSIAKLGVTTRLKKGGRSTKDGICLNLESQSEITTEHGLKLGASICTDDGLIFRMHGVILVTDAWTRVYDFMKLKPSRARATSLRAIDPRITTTAVIDQLCQDINGGVTTPYSTVDMKTMEFLVPAFDPGRWQE